jgi:hypothetical protein
MAVDAPVWFGPYGRGALEHVENVVTYGANAVWFHEFDAEAFSICEQHGLAACVEFKTFRADFHQHPELIPIGIDGKPIRYGRLVQGVCLSQQAFLEETETRLRAGVQAFRPAGIWLDYLTYAGWFEVPDPDLQESCFCPACVADFCEATGTDAAEPSQILARYQPAWTKHKCERIAGFARRYAEVIRTSLPACVIGAYMCPWTPAEFSGALSRIFAQDYRLLAPSIDVFTPLIYAAKSGRPPTWAADFLRAAPSFVPGECKVQLILDVLDFPDSLWATAEAQPASWGVQIFGGAQVFADSAKAQVFRQAVAQMRRRLLLAQ